MYAAVGPNPWTLLQLWGILGWQRPPRAAAAAHPRQVEPGQLWPAMSTQPVAPMDPAGKHPYAQ